MSEEQAEFPFPLNSGSRDSNTARAPERKSEPVVVLPTLTQRGQVIGSTRVNLPGSIEIGEATDLNHIFGPLRIRLAPGDLDELGSETLIHARFPTRF